MMENYQETCNKSERSEQLEVICQASIMNAQICGTDLHQEENYNFGAEILKQIDNNDGDEINKTINAVENIISTKTEQPCATTTATTAAVTTTIITEAAASDSGISLENPSQSDKCDYDTAEDGDLGEDEADDENEDSLDDENSPPPSTYAHNTRHKHEPPIRDGSVVDSSDDDTSTSTDSDFSDISGLSDVSGKEWKPVNRKPILWVQKQIHSGRNPRELLSRFLPAGAQSITLGLNDMSLWRLLANMLSEPPRRQKLRYVNTFEDVIQLILKSKNIVVLTGAGVSVSCGIPDFRSSDGIYSRLAKDYPNLPDPQAMFDIDYFSRDPRPFYKFAREIYPGQFKPSPCHRFIKLLEEKQLLLRNYTQNIDTLEQVAGIKRVIECHGSFSTASCTKCKFKCDADAIRADIFAQRIPVCPRCQPHVCQSVDASEPVSEYDLRWIVANGIMKPDIVFFGEGLPEEFHKVMASDKDKCDLLIVIGSSLKVRPVALIPSSLPANVPQILINREQLNHLEFDVELLGDSDVIINQICHRLGDDWKQICFDEHVLQESKELQPFDENDDDDNDVDCDDDGDDDNEKTHNDDDEFGNIINENESEKCQTIKSNLTVGINFHAHAATAAANAASHADSGFESTTSLNQIETPENIIELVEIENIKTSILAYNERPNESDDNDFQPFSVRLGQDTLMTPPTLASSSAIGVSGESFRHLSIDSTKDSGIQCDSSNSMATITTLSGGADNEFNELACSSTTAAATAAAAALKTATKMSEDYTKSQQQQNSTDDSDDAQQPPPPPPGSLKRQRKSKSCSAAEFLIDGTYYYHKNSSSYVFPGAQISWYADDSEDTDLEEEHCGDEDNNKEKECAAVGVAENGVLEAADPLAKCDTSVEEAASVAACTSTNADNSTDDVVSPLRAAADGAGIGIKRNSAQNLNDDELSATKKCRLDTEFVAITPATTAILTTTINTSTVCCSNDVANNTNTTNRQALETASSTTTTLPSTIDTLQNI